MTLAVGTRLGPYEIQSAIGAGGMGEVYKARDTRLDRTVAIKILPPAVAAYPERRVRFEREAKTVAGLSHPHICPLFDVGDHDGTTFLVMEYLAGETLAERLQKGALPSLQALTIATEIADALAAAHGQGVIHRDLKPGNVMLTKSGAKLLDFGLAKLMPQEALASSTISTLSTHAPATRTATVLGTVPYMAPEQLEGMNADARSDIFSFGVLVYEMLTGRRPFDGKTHASVIAAILEQEPEPIGNVHPLLPVGLQHLVRACLAKNPEDRIQSAHDVKLQLRWIVAAGSQAGVPAVALRKRLDWRLLALLSMVVAAVTITAVMSSTSRPGKQPPMARFTLDTPAGAIVMPQGLSGATSISPDGKYVAYLARMASGPPQLYLRALHSLETRVLAGTENALYPFWSPDGRTIAFSADGGLKKIELSGGAVQTICDLPSRTGIGGTWNGEGTILFGSSEGPIYRVSASGGQPAPVTKLNAAAGELRHVAPWFLPDGEHFLFLAVTRTREKRAIWAASLEDESRTIVVAENSNPAFAAGHIFFSREQMLMAQPFNPEMRRVTGEAFVAADSLSSNYVSGLAAFTVSGEGVIEYTPNAEPVQLMWLKSDGEVQEPAAVAGDYMGFGLSPDETRVAVVKREKGRTNADVWVVEGGQRTSRVTSAAGMVRGAVWSPDGKEIAFGRFNYDGSAALSVILATGADQHVLTEMGGVPTSWSRDGRWLAFSEFRADSRWNLLVLNLSNGKVTPFLATASSEYQGQFSPDGRWMAYVSDESGDREIYVRSFPDGAQKRKISTFGGDFPVWSQNGDRLFYEADDSVMAVGVKVLDDNLLAGTPAKLFSLPGNRGSWTVGGASGSLGPLVGPGMHVTRDGRFLVEWSPPGTRSPMIVVIVNWQPAAAKQP